ncbi:uncharacterized protein LOC117177076 [Belonocnema kinseyi]|uniref:uncharacterized protein LOC117177076 n=1 Tax=Belonocnema kinseyi TaxID=2817044 RepID=UPI00143D74C8|nr:uncharacterized protein LOC117177076 [Belonocnema kinseyi]
MLKFVFYLCISTLIFRECSGFWFDLFNFDNEKSTTDSSSENCFDELVDWISKCFFGLDSKTGKPNSKPPVQNLTTPGQINPDLGTKNSSVTEKPISASNASPDTNSVKPALSAVTQSASISSATDKDDNTKIKNPPALSQNTVKKDDNTQIQNPTSLSQNSLKKDDKNEMQNPAALIQDSTKKENIAETPNSPELSQNSDKKDDNSQIQNPTELPANSPKKEENTPSEETNAGTT